MEAMACGCPVVATDCPSGPTEILENGKYGPLVPVEDANDLADAILRCLKGDPLHRPSGSASRAVFLPAPPPRSKSVDAVEQHPLLVAPGNGEGNRDIGGQQEQRLPAFLEA